LARINAFVFLPYLSDTFILHTSFALSFIDVKPFCGHFSRISFHLIICICRCC